LWLNNAQTRRWLSGWWTVMAHKPGKPGSFPWFSHRLHAFTAIFPALASLSLKTTCQQQVNQLEHF
jgi:hypothetical protein